MAQMLRHKETGELFIYTDLYSRLPELELVTEDPVQKVIEEIAAAGAVAEVKAEVEAPVARAIIGKPKHPHGK